MRRVRIFATNIECVKDVEFVINALNTVFPQFIINVDIEDCDRILRIESHNEVIYARKIIKVVKEKGFECAIFKD